MALEDRSLTPDRAPATPVTVRGELARALTDEHLAVAERTRDALLGDITAFGELLCDALADGGKLLTFGNGGSAADAQHFSAELTGHFVADRDPLAAVALTTDTSALTAIANDYSFDEVFARQVRALARPGDVAVGITTSGGAVNVRRGLQAAREAGATTVALTGATGADLRAVSDLALVVPSEVTARIQEMHILVIHIVCALIDERFLGRPPAR